MPHQTNFKPERVIDKVRNHIQRRKTVTDEQRIMRAVRREDRYCRFPLCGCGRLKLTLEVAHAGEHGHRGMGGNRSLSATTPENLILLCRPRHRAHKFSVDKKALRVEALTQSLGLRGPVQWLIARSDIPRELIEGMTPLPPYGAWAVLAVERFPHECEPFTEAQRVILEMLAGMEC